MTILNKVVRWVGKTIGMKSTPVTAELPAWLPG